MACMNKCSLFLLVSAVIFLVIGLSTFLTGCDSKLQPKCINYKVVNANISQYVINNFTCTRCTSHYRYCRNVAGKTRCYTTCTSSESYDCYSLDVEFAVNGVSVCNKNIYDRVGNFSSSYLTEYPIGKIVELYISKTDKKCYFDDFPKRLAIVGFVFLILTGFTLLMCIITYIACRKKSRHIANNNEPSF